MGVGYGDQMLEAKAVKMATGFDLPDLTTFLQMTKTPSLKPLMQTNNPRKRGRNRNGDKQTCFPSIMIEYQKHYVGGLSLNRLT